MKKLLSCLLTFAVMTGIFPGCLLTCQAAEDEISYDQVASDEEKTSVQEVGVEGMLPIYGTEVADGVYQVEMESSSSMFHVTAAELTVREGRMEAVLTLSGEGYLKLFMGTAAEAAASDGSSYIDYVTDAEGKYTYTVPVEALDLPIACAAFSRNKEKWYDRQILFQAESLPSEAVLTELPDYEALRREAKRKRIEAIKAENDNDQETSEADGGQDQAEPAFIEMEDGEYAIGVEVVGGTGRTTISSPAGLIVKDGLAYARIEWSSSSYDYMIVGGEKYLPVNEEGYSTFEIPILVFNEEMPVIADTTAMSTPHEIDYSLRFLTDTITSKNQTPREAAKRVVYMVIAIIAVCMAVSFVSKRRRYS